MISVNQAITLLETNLAPTSESMLVECRNALNEVLADNVYAGLDLPPFRQSVMDGYALRLHNKGSYNIVGEVPTGSDFNPTMEAGDAVRIFTGAAVPREANAVVMQEHVERNGEQLDIQRAVKPQQFIRQVGEQIRKGDLALTKGTEITPAVIGFLSALGIEKVKVFKKPSVALLVTGDELRDPGEKLDFGQIFESNSAMLQTALFSSGFDKVERHKVKDKLDATQTLLKELLSENDVVLVSGGISVGDYDFVGKALTNLGVEEVFYKVKQKPGKPLFFGKKENKTVFALPGNPASSLSCFYLYVLPALRLISGFTEPHLERRMVRVEDQYNKDASRAHFLKGKYSSDRVSILDGQASSMIHSFAMANVLIHIPEETLEVKKGQLVETIFLPL